MTAAPAKPQCMQGLPCMLAESASQPSASPRKYFCLLLKIASFLTFFYAEIRGQRIGISKISLLPAGEDKKCHGNHCQRPYYNELVTMYRVPTQSMVSILITQSKFITHSLQTFQISKYTGL